MPTVILRHAVQDFETWFSFAGDRTSNILANGAASVRTFRDVDDPNSVLLVIDVEDMGKFRAMLNSEGGKRARARHGVLDPVILSKEVEPGGGGG